VEIAFKPPLEDNIEDPFGFLEKIFNIVTNNQYLEE